MRLTLRTRSAVLGTIALSLLTLACNDAAPGITDPANAGLADAEPQAVQGHLDEVQTIVAAFDAAWNAGNASGYAALYSDDADFISPIGVVLESRAAIESQHAFLFAGPFQGSTHTSTIRSITFLTGTVAVVNLNVELTHFVALPPGLPAAGPDLVRTRERLIVVKRRGVWEIAMNQVTAVAPIP